MIDFVENDSAVPLKPEQLGKVPVKTRVRWTDRGVRFGHVLEVDGETLIVREESGPVRTLWAEHTAIFPLGPVP